MMKKEEEETRTCAPKDKRYPRPPRRRASSSTRDNKAILHPIDTNQRKSSRTFKMTSSKRSSTPRRRSLSSPEGADAALKKRPRYNRSRSCDADFFKREFEPLSLMSLKKSASADGFGAVVQTHFSPRGRTGDAGKNFSPPPSEKLRRLMARFKITASPLSSPINSRNKSGDDDSAKDSSTFIPLHHPSLGSSKAARKLMLLSQLPKTNDEEDAKRNDDDNHSVRTPDDKDRDECSYETPPGIALVGHDNHTNVFDDMFSEETTNSTTLNLLGDTSEPTMPDFLRVADGTEDSKTAPSSENKTKSNQFSILKSPFRSGKSFANKISSFFSPCSFVSSTPARSNTSTPSAVDNMCTPSVNNHPDSGNRVPNSASQHHLVSSCRREDSSSARKLTPSNTKLKIMPQRPCKGGKKKLRRQRSLRMCNAPCLSASKALSSKPRVNHLERRRGALKKRPATISSLSSLGGNGDLNRSSSSMKDLVAYMKKQDVRMLALDWDHTCLRIHTKSQWYGTAAELKGCIRPKFTTLIRAAHKVGIHISVVTFSEQVQLVEDVLEITFPNIACGPRPIVVRGNGGGSTWQVADTVDHSYVPKDQRSSGKVPHILSAIEALHARAAGQPNVDDVPTKPQHVVLIDDDIENIRSAMACNFHSFWMNVDEPHTIWLSMMLLFTGSE